jgi:hypothetical protein
MAHDFVELAVLRRMRSPRWRLCGLTDDRVERKVFEAAPVFHEMNRAVHVRAGVRGHGQMRNVAGRAVDADLRDEMDFDGGVAVPMNHAIDDGE